jgi:hypothetical protein
VHCPPEGLENRVWSIQTQRLCLDPQNTSRVGFRILSQRKSYCDPASGSSVL